MDLTDREIKLLADIEQWENSYFDVESTDFDRAYQKWLHKAFSNFGEQKQEKMLGTIDNFLFHLNALIQNSRFHDEARSRLIVQAQVFHSDVETISDIKYLPIEQKNFIASQQVAKQRLLSLGQGGLAGMGGIALLGADIPAMLVINLRAIQLVALSYGYEIKRPFEMMIALKVFHTASLPKELQKGAWDALWQEVEENETDELFYSGKDEIFEVSWLTQPIRQMLKAIVIMTLRKKMIQGIPLVGIAFGATMNYQFSRKVTKLAERFYQKRAIHEKLA